MSIELTPAGRRSQREKIFRPRRKHFSPARFKHWREQRGMSQEALAKKIDYTRAQVSGVERGISAPSLEFLDAVIVALNLQMEDLWA